MKEYFGGLWRESEAFFTPFDGTGL